MHVDGIRDRSSRKSSAFQAEIKQLLHLLAHSLYQSKEIAIRELISNASDALDKMRYVALTDESQRDDAPLEIVARRAEGRRASWSIRDNGIGMTHDELVTNLGTIAHSGSREFLKSAVEPADRATRTTLSLIGQFGVGFYSAFMIADKVRVRIAELQGRAGLGVGVGRHGHVPRLAGRGPAARHRDRPPPQGRRQGLRRGLEDQDDHPRAIRASSRTRSRSAARSSTARSRSGSSPRAR